MIGGITRIIAAGSAPRTSECGSARRWRPYLATVALLHTVAGQALAQTPVDMPDEKAGTVTWLVAAGLVAVACAAAFMNPKRSHLT